MTAREIEYLSVGDIVGMHDLILETMGEPYAPLRDIGVLQGAIARPRNAAYYTGADLVRQACILMVAIAEAQPFLEGNKRAGMVSGLAFLERNGYQFVGDDILLAVLLVEASGTSQEQAVDDIDTWIRPFLDPSPTGEISP